MCGCAGGSSNKGVSSVCGNKVSRLTKVRNKLVILFNIETDPEIKAKYKEDRSTVDAILKEVAISGSCPDLSTVVLIETEINNEYTKHNNT